MRRLKQEEVLMAQQTRKRTKGNKGVTIRDVSTRRRGYGQGHNMSTYKQRLSGLKLG